MTIECRPAWSTLQDFTKILYEYDPVGLNNPTNPDAENEYQGEALSILCRFYESLLFVRNSPEQELHDAQKIVEMSFLAWFGPKVMVREPAALAKLLLEHFQSGYPQCEQVDAPDVRSEQ